MARPFTAELERRLRAVLALRVQAPLPSDVPIEIGVIRGGRDKGELEIRTKAHPYAAWSYEEPGAWEMLLADLDAIPDAPTGPENATQPAAPRHDGAHD